MTRPQPFEYTTCPCGARRFSKVPATHPAERTASGRAVLTCKCGLSYTASVDVEQNGRSDRQ